VKRQLSVDFTDLSFEVAVREWVLIVELELL
jgi:hypothetical protein